MPDRDDGAGGAGERPSDSPPPLDPGAGQHEAAGDPAPYRIETLSYGWELSWSLGRRPPQVALVVAEDVEAHIYRCCRCRVSSCSHAAAVRELVRRNAS